MPQFVSNPIESPIGDNLFADGTDGTPPDGYQRLDVGYSQEHLDASYIRQSLTVSYTGDSGLLQVPVGAPWQQGQAKIPCKVVRAHAPIMRKVVTYSYVRLDDIPVVPSPETNDSNLTLLQHVQTPLAAHELRAGRFAYGLSGQYIYALTLPLETADDKVFGRNPAYKAGSVECHIGSDDFDSTLQTC